MFGVVWGYYNLQLQGKQYKQNTSPSYKTEINWKFSLTLGYLNQALNNPAQASEREKELFKFQHNV